MKGYIRYFSVAVVLIGSVIFCTITCSSSVNEKEKPAKSAQTEACIGCHLYLNPGLVKHWEAGRHAQITPTVALEKDDLQKRISAQKVPEQLKNVVVGCYECHSLNTDKHADAFDHNGFKINIVVSSADCATCHPVEKEQFEKNLMSHARGNLLDNSVYTDLRQTINSTYQFKNGAFGLTKSNNKTEADACLYCHGTKLEVTGMEQRETEFGTLDIPVIKGWPNQGVGRINTDGSMGSCTSCHPRHDFSIATARSPHTCAECHKGPDVPAYKVYQASKHGNIFAAQQKQFNMSEVPWKIGNDFQVPTCATCHVSLITDADGKILAERTHQFNDRLAWRLFGVPYAHPHPIKPDINVMENSAGLPLAVELTGEPVSKYLITKEEQEQRNLTLQKVCKGCHGQGWVNGHFERLDNTIETTNKNTLAATAILSEAWEKGYAKGLPQKASIFDESIERDWTTTWLFYANSIRFTSAMGGGGDYGVFANGRYQMTDQLMDMKEWLEWHKKMED